MKLGLCEAGGPLYSHTFLSYALESSLALPALYAWLQARGVTLETRWLLTAPQSPLSPVIIPAHCTPL
jgi:hypothetical protein